MSRMSQVNGKLAASHVARARHYARIVASHDYGKPGTRELDSHCDIARDLAAKAWHFAERALAIIEIEQDIAHLTKREREVAA